MSEWRSTQLGDHAEVLSGFPFPSEGFSQEEGVPLIRIRDLLADKVETYFIGPYPDEFVIDDGDILIGMDGDFNIVRWTKGKALLNQRVCKVFTSTAELDNGYLFWLLAPELQNIHQKTPQTTVKHLSVRDLAQLRLEAPPVNEQRLIAHILDTLDTQIQKTEALIAKLEKVKEGLLHDLLTRGIDENGHLRPSPEQAPELYKESPLGLIPRDWEARPLGDSIEKVIDYRGRTPKKLGMDWGGDILALSANNVQPGAIDTSREAYFGGNRLYRRWMTNGDVKRSDVLLTMEAPLGNVARVPDDAKYIMSQRVIALRFKKEYALNDFSFWAMQSAEFQQAMKERSTGSTATGIQRTQLFKLYLKVPTLNEQDLIARKVFSLNSRLKKESGALVKLKKEKFGLMDDLLTGRVRVTPLLDTTQATTPA